MPPKWMQFLFFCIVTNFFNFSNSTLDVDLIYNFLNFNSLHLSVIIFCNKNEIIPVTRKFDGKIKFIFFDIQNNKTTLGKRIIVENNNHLGIVLDGDCKNAQNVLTESGENKYFNDTHHWLIQTNAKDNILKYLRDIPLNISAEINMAENLHNDNGFFKIYEVYNPAHNHGGELKNEEIGFFDRQKMVYYIHFRGSKYWVRKNMTGVNFKSAVVLPKLNEKLEDYLASEEHREINSQHRFQSVTVRYCRDLYNFTLKEQRTDSWGYKQIDGHFNGLVGLLERREVDFGSSPLLYKLDRLPVVGYSFGNWILKSTFIYRRPRRTQASYAIFLQPLSESVWYSLSFCIIIIVIILHFSWKIEQIVFRKVKMFIEWSWSNLILFTIAALCQQGVPINICMTSNRIASITIFLFSLMIYQFYSANIVSLLLRVPPRTINTLEDLRDSTLRLGIEDIAIDHAFFAETSYQVAKEMFEKKIKNSNNNSGFYDPEAGLELVKKGGFAFHVETSTAYPIIEETFSDQEICDLEEVQMYRTQPMHTNLQKGSPFLEIMNYCMLRLVENGEMHRLRKYWDQSKPECLAARTGGLHPVAGSEFSFALAVLGVGMSISLFVLVVEVLGKRRQKHKQSKVVENLVLFPYVN